MLHKGIFIIVPVYNSEQSVAALVQRLQPVLEAEAAEYELILVNDGSSDQSWDVSWKITLSEGLN